MVATHRTTLQLPSLYVVFIDFILFLCYCIYFYSNSAIIFSVVCAIVNHSESFMDSFTI